MYTMNHVVDAVATVIDNLNEIDNTVELENDRQVDDLEYSNLNQLLGKLQMILAMPEVLKSEYVQSLMKEFEEANDKIYN